MIGTSGQRRIQSRVCPICKSSYRPWSTTQQVCGRVACALEHARQREANKARVEKKRARLELRAQRELMKTVGQLTDEAQAAFNKFVRRRDELALLPCPSCGAVDPPGGFGGAWDCGHFRTIGAAPELRFEPLNAWRQCKVCNSGVRRHGRRVLVAHDAERAATIRMRYRATLLLRIGHEKLAWLEGPHQPKRYRADELRELKATYQRMTREITTARGKTG